MDPIHPIAPGPPAIPRSGTAPVQRLPPVSRERDRPTADQRERKRRRPPAQEPAPERDGEDGEHRHIDVRA